MKRLFSNLAVRVMASVIMLLVIFSGIVGVIGYIRFTRSFTAEYTESAFHTAETAALLVDAGRLGHYLETGGRGEDYAQTRRLLNILCQKQDVDLIYVIRPDTSDYGSFTSVFNVVNVNSGFTPWETGHVRKTTNEEYRNIYRSIYEEGLERGVVVRTRDLNGGKPHITLLIPVKSVQEEVEGILCVQRDMNELSSGRRRYLIWVAAAFILSALAASVSAALFFRSQLVLPLRTVAGEARRFAAENTAAPDGALRGLSSIREIDTLAASVEKMESDTLLYMDHLTRVTADRERISTELGLAARIQEGMLPHVFPPYPERREFGLFASMFPAKEVGGDFYDFFFIDADHLAMVMADVSGKGIPGALFMMISKTLLKNRLLGGDSPAGALENVNRLICANNEAGMFVTVWLAVLDVKTGKGLAANAGHEHPALRRAGGRYELVKYRHSPAVGVMESIRFHEHGFELWPGDSLFVYTDGVTEASDVSQRLFGTDRLTDALNTEPGSGPRETLENVMDAIRSFADGAEQFDDITMLCFTYHGPEGGNTET